MPKRDKWNKYHLKIRYKSEIIFLLLLSFVAVKEECIQKDLHWDLSLLFDDTRVIFLNFPFICDFGWRCFFTLCIVVKVRPALMPDSSMTNISISMMWWSWKLTPRSNFPHHWTQFSIEIAEAIKIYSDPIYWQVKMFLFSLTLFCVAHELKCRTCAIQSAFFMNIKKKMENRKKRTFSSID